MEQVRDAASVCVAALRLPACGDQKSDQVPVNDPPLPVEALVGQERRRYHNYRRRLDPLGQGHIDTWRTMLIKVAGEVTQFAASWLPSRSTGHT